MQFIPLKNILFHHYGKLILSSIVLFFIVNLGFSQNAFPDISKDKKGKVVSVSDSLGNKIPDFSYAGYMASEKQIPFVEAKIFVPKQDGDATFKIQLALDYVSNLKSNASGFRGAVLLDKGTFKINGTLYIKNSGVVLRGSGNAENETILLGTGIEREAIIRVLGIDDKTYKDTLQFNTNYTPLGTQKIQLKNTSKLKISDEILIKQPLTDNWIKELKMNDFGGETGWIGWKARDWDISWNRVVKNINGNEVSLNAPLTMTLDANYGEANVITYSWKGRIENVGVENLSIQSTFDETNQKDELHRWFGISMENVKMLGFVKSTLNI